VIAACCLMLEHLPDPRPPFVEAAAGRLPLWMGLTGVQASSSKQTSGIKQLASKAKH